MDGLQQTYINESLPSSRADLNKTDFDKLVAEKGCNVIYEKALRCPCKSASINQLSNCKNCGGTGWIFVNPVEARMILQSIDVVRKNEGWSEELRGMITVTAIAEQKLCHMDRITDMDGESVHTEVLNFRKKGTTIFAYTGYNVKSLIYIGLWKGANTKLEQIVPTTDYTLSGNIIQLNTTKYGSVDIEALSITVRYEHMPTFHVIEMKREIMQSIKIIDGKEQSQAFPISAYAKRAHYQLDAPNLTGDRLLNNDYVE